MGKRDAIAVGDEHHTSTDRVLAAGDVTSGEMLIVKAMEKGRGGARRVHEYLMDLEASPISFYERYYKQRSYKEMLEGKEDKGLPPD